MFKVKIKKVFDNAIVPTRGSVNAAGWDLYTLDDKSETHIYPGETFSFHTGIAMEISDGYAGLIFARSGLGIKHGLIPSNATGVIDSDFRGEAIVALYNHSKDVQIITGGERIAQIVFVPYLTNDLELTDSLTDTKRGSNGFGSTGTK